MYFQINCFLSFVNGFKKIKIIIKMFVPILQTESRKMRKQGIKNRWIFVNPILQIFSKSASKGNILLARSPRSFTCHSDAVSTVQCTLSIVYDVFVSEDKLYPRTDCSLARLSYETFCIHDVSVLWTFCARDNFDQGRVLKQKIITFCLRTWS